MKTSVIRYRVADFLRSYPPFDVISLEDLLTLAGSGRVIFHEDDIYLFRQGEPRESVIWIVQQGRIEMIEEQAQGQQLRDVLGPGDILGLRRHAADSTYKRTARTATEVIFYSFELSAIEALAAKYPEAERFLTAHLSAATHLTKALQAPVTRERLLTEKEKSSWLNAEGLPQEWLARRLAACAATLPISQVAKQMAHAQSEVLAVVAGNGSTLGLITSAELRDQIATGLLSPEMPAEKLMNCNFSAAATGLKMTDYWLTMLRNRSPWLVLTDSGSPNASLRGLLADTDLEVACGKNPVRLLRELQAARTLPELVYLWQRIKALFTETLVGPSVVEWLLHMLGELKAVLIERVVQISVAELAAVGRHEPGVTYCWLLFGNAGRRELVTSVLPELGVVWADSPTDNAAAVESYFATLLQKVTAKLEACGLQAKPTDADPDSIERQPCQSLSQWKQFYRDLIYDPIINQIYTARQYFDFEAASGDLSLGAELKQFLRDELHSSEAFIPVLANDTIARLPPLTFYQGFVIETDGRVNQTLDLEQTALTPITDAARVLAFTERDVTTANTLQRLRNLVKALPQYASILHDAAEAWLIVSYHHAQTEWANPGTNRVIYPARLSRFEQRLLKVAFDSTRRLVELASSFHPLT